MGTKTQRSIILVILVLCGNIASFMLFSVLQKGPAPAPERYPVLGQDSSTYAILADNLIARHTFSDPNNPLQPYHHWHIAYTIFLAATKYLSGGFVLAVILQVLAGVFAALLLFRMAQTFLPEQFALIPALLFALNPHVLFLNTSILTDGIFTSCVIIIVYLLFFAAPQKTPRYFFGIGILLALATLLRPIAQFFVLLLPILSVWYAHIPLRHAWRVGGALVAGFALLMAPWILRNTIVFGAPEIAHASNANLLYYDVRDFLLFKELRAGGNRTPILLAATPLYTPQAQRAIANVEKRIDSDLAALTPHGRNPENYYGTLAYRYILQSPFSYAYFHIVNTAPFFLLGDVRAYEVQIRSIQTRNGIPSTPASLFDAWHAFRSKTTLPTERIWALRTLAPSAFELLWNCIVVFFSLIALLYAGRNRFVPVCAALVVYFALLTGPLGTDTPRLHIPAEPFLLLLAGAGVVAAVPLLQELHRRRVPYARFLIAGIAMSIFDVAVLYIGTRFLKLHYLLCASIALGITCAVTFLLNRQRVCRGGKEKRPPLGTPRYVGFALCAIMFNVVALWFFVHELLLPLIASQLTIALLAVFIKATLSVTANQQRMFQTFPAGGAS